MKTLLIADDEYGVRMSLRTVFDRDYRIVEAQNGEDALRLAEQEAPDLALVDLRMPKIPGLNLIPRLKSLDPHLAIVVLSALKDVPTVFEAMQSGAVYYLTKPFDVREIKLVLDLALQSRSRSIELSTLASDVARWYDPGKIIGDSRVWLKTLELARRAAAVDSTVTLLGESGTGKELIARMIHQLSPRCKSPLVTIHCAAIPEQLLESELFGHEKGSFTGAYERSRGHIEIADGGTLFLDEIGEMPLSMQVKMLRFLQERQFMRVGGRAIQDADVRVIAATNRDLESAVEEGGFRNDLYYRLNVLPIKLPPLRDRKEDIESLTHHFLACFRRERSMAMQSISQSALKLLMSYHWPGNVRELRGIIERISVIYADQAQLLPEHLPSEIHQGKARSNTLNSAPQELEFPLSLEDEVGTLERRLINQAVQQAGGNLSQAAVLLQTTRRKLAYKMAAHGLV